MTSPVTTNNQKQSSFTEKENIQDEGPPKAPRTAFICFRDVKMEEMEDVTTSKKNLFQRIAVVWRKLSSSERAYWDEVARNDKLRYSQEKAAYKGPWNIPKRRAKKHPLAPRRPMSAFLKFSKTNRALVRNENPNVTNTDVSRLLGERWRNMSEEEKRQYRDTERAEREDYKQKMARFKAQQARIDASSRTHHSVISLPSMTPHHPEETDRSQEARPYEFGIAQEVQEYENNSKNYSNSTTPLFRGSNSSRDFIPSSWQVITNERSNQYLHCYHDDSRSLSYTNSMPHRHLTARIGSFAEAPSFDSFVDSIQEPMPAALEYQPAEFDPRQHQDDASRRTFRWNNNAAYHCD